MSFSVKAMESFADFILSQPSLEQMAAFCFPDSLDAELHRHLDKNSRGTLSKEENKELDAVLNLGHLVTLLKAKALDVMEIDSK